MVKATEQLPAPCRDNRAANASEQYLKWQADVVSFRQSQIAEELPGLDVEEGTHPTTQKRHLAFRLQQGRNYFLAQDDFAITVVQREPLKVAFQIPTSEARRASFTPMESLWCLVPKVCVLKSGASPMQNQLRFASWLSGATVGNMSSHPTVNISLALITVWA